VGDIFTNYIVLAKTTHCNTKTEKRVATAINNMTLNLKGNL